MEKNMKIKINKINLFILLLAFSCLFLISGCKTEEKIKNTPVVVDFEVRGIKEKYSQNEIVDVGQWKIILHLSDESTTTIDAFDPNLTIGEVNTDEIGEKTFSIIYSLSDGQTIEKSYTYEVIQIVVTLDFNGGTYDDKSSTELVATAMQVDVSQIIPTKLDEFGTPLKFSGWFYDQALTTRVNYVADGFISTSESITIYAGYDVDYTNIFEYEIRDDNTVEILGITNDGILNFMMEPELVIPETIELYPVTSIGDLFIFTRDPLTNEKDETFSWTVFINIDTIVFPENSKVTHIGKRAFEAMQISSVQFPNTLETIGEAAFRSTALAGDLVLPASLKTIGDYAFQYVSGALENISFASGSELKHIGRYAFASCSTVVSITLPNSLEEIMSNAFDGCTQIETITIPSNVHSIGLYAFKSMRSLKEINVDPNNATYSSLDGDLYSIDHKTIIRYCYGKQEETFVLPETVEIIEEGAFNIFNDITSLKTIVLNEGLKYIGSDAFSGCSMTFKLPSTLNEIATQAFNGWNGDSFEIDPANQTFTVYQGILYSKDMKTLYAVPRNLKDVTSLVLDPRVELIKSHAFCGNTTIRYITIPENSNLNKIDEYGLNIYSMSSLKGVYIFKQTPFEVVNGAFYEQHNFVANNVTVFVLGNNLNSYKEAWKNYQNNSETVENYNIQDNIVDCLSAKERLLDYLKETTKYISYETYNKGVTPYIKQDFASMKYTFQATLDYLISLYQEDDINNDVYNYFKLFEQQLYEIAADYFLDTYNNLHSFDNLDLKYLADIVTRYNECPKIIQDAINENYLKLKSLYDEINNIEATRQQIINELINFPCSATQFDAEKFNELNQRFIAANMDAISLPESVFYKYQLLDASSKIAELLAIETFSLDNKVRARTLIQGDFTNMGINSILESFLRTDESRKDLYRYQDYLTKAMQFSEYEANDIVAIQEEVASFDLSSECPIETMEELFRKIDSLTNIYELDSFEYNYIDKIYAIHLKHDMLFVINNGNEITEENSIDLYLSCMNVEMWVMMLMYSVDYSTFQEQLATEFSLYDVKNQEITTYINDQLSSIYSDIEDLSTFSSTKYLELVSKIEKLNGHYELMDFEAYHQYFILGISYQIDQLLNQYTSVTKDNYQEIDYILNGYYDKENDETINGIESLIAQSGLYEDLSTYIYRYDEYLEFLNLFNEF